MIAAQVTSYGSPETITINEETLKPTLKQGQVLVEVYASSINAIDWKMRSGFMQKMTSIKLPYTIGGDFSGKITSIGESVDNLKVGDEVYGQAIVLNGGSGAMAEYVAANAANTSLRPKNISMSESAALPLVGVSAIEAIEENIKLKKDQKVLIHGGAGGIGHLAIQLAKSKGAFVATTVSAKDVDFVKSIGADEVIDYQVKKFEEILSNFDAVFDTVGGETTIKSFQVLKRGGVIVSMVGKPDDNLSQQHAVENIGQVTKPDSAHLSYLRELVENGTLKVHIDKTFPLVKVQDAFLYQEKGHPQGKVVVEVK